MTSDEHGPRRGLGNPSYTIPLAEAQERERYFYLDGSALDQCSALFFMGRGMAVQAWRCRPDTCGCHLLASRLHAACGSPSPSRPCRSVHPDLNGRRVLAELLAQPLVTAVEEEAAGTPVQQRQDVRLAGLPPPMIPNSRELSPSTCYVLVRSWHLMGTTGCLEWMCPVVGRLQAHGSMPHAALEQRQATSWARHHALPHHAPCLPHSPLLRQARPARTGGLQAAGQGSPRV